MSKNIKTQRITFPDVKTTADRNRKLYDMFIERGGDGGRIGIIVGMGTDGTVISCMEGSLPPDLAVELVGSFLASLMQEHLETCPDCKNKIDNGQEPDLSGHISERIGTLGVVPNGRNKLDPSEIN